MKKLLVLFLLGFFYSCNQSTSENSFTYFGGQIINPKYDYVFLVKDGQVIDSTLLDKEHKFLMKLNLNEEGLFHFKHGNEFQYLYLEPTDSVLVRLNTWDFDESIVFTGKGAEKNNFLINLFLINELEDKNFYPFYQYNPKEFSQKIDSTINYKQKLFKEFQKANKNISDNFIKIAKTGIILPSYRKKENFTYGHKKVMNLDTYPEVDSMFYDYRSQINLNDTTLLYFHPYQNYLNSFVYNKVATLKEKDTLNKSFSFLALHFIVDTFENPKIKNVLLKHSIMDSFLRKNNSKFEEDELDFYIKNSTDVEDIKMIKKLMSDSKSIANNEILNDFVILDGKNQPINIKTLIKDKKTVLYFWSPSILSEEYLASRIQLLEAKHPSFIFIGLNTDSRPESLNKSSATALKHQYFLPKNSNGNIHHSSTFPRTILIDKDSRIFNNFTFLASKHFDHQLLELEKK